MICCAIAREHFPREYREHDWSNACLSMTFFFGTRHKRDRDNCIAWMKSGIDGIADGIGVDDAGFHYRSPTIGHDKDKPRVEVEIDRVMLR